MKYTNVRLLVGDFSTALTFWRDVINVPLSFSDEATGYAYFDSGNGGLELYSRDQFAAAIGESAPVPKPVGHQAVLVFEVDNVDEAYEDLVKRGAAAVARPLDRPLWRVRAAHVGDPDGHLIEIFSRLPESEEHTV